MKTDLPRVAVVVDTSTSWGRDVVEGIANYVRGTRPWYVYLKPLDRKDEPLIPEGWDGDGVIARVRNRSMWKTVGATGCPVVNVSGVEIKGIDLPRVALDEEACASMAVRHLKELGLTHFAHYVEPDRSYTRPRREVFDRAFKEAGLDCTVYRRRSRARSGVSWPALRHDMGEWLTKLPKPVGITCWGLFQARQLSELCLEFDLMIPEDVAILAIGSDRMLGAVVPPTLSQMNLQSKRQGYLAAEMLDLLMQGKRLKQRDVRLPPLGIITHESTDLQAIADPDLRRAINFIRTHIESQLTVNDVVREVPLSRRGLERRFRALLNRSPAEEIRRARLDKTCSLLADTNLPMPDVAHACGWAYVEYMIPAFKRELGLTPLQYRKRVQVRS